MGIETFILIAFFKYGSGSAAITQEFDSKLACEFAMQQIEKVSGGYTWMVCVPKFAEGRT